MLRSTSRSSVQRETGPAHWLSTVAAIAPASAVMSSPPVESAETNGEEIKTKEPSVTQAQWEAMDRVIKGAYTHRLTE